MKPTRLQLAIAARSQEFADAAPAHWPMAIHPVALAKPDCVFCHGLGIDPGSGKKIKRQICACVYRQVFRICLTRYLTLKDDMRTTAVIEVGRGAPNCTRPKTEYLADFETVSARKLPSQELRNVFQYHFLQGGDWKFCIERMSIDKGRFFHLVYLAQEMLGREFATVQPFRLFPLDEYFGVTSADLTQVNGGRSTPRQILPEADFDVPPWHMPKKKSCKQPIVIPRSLPLAA